MGAEPRWSAAMERRGGRARRAGASARPWALGLGLCVLLAVAPPGAAAPSGLGLSVTEHRLGNGLRLLLTENHDLPTLSLWSYYRVGSRNERPGLTGISHLFEHMMFNGAAKYGPKEFDIQLESNGGYSNAFTERDMTAYFETFPKSILPLVLDLESDRMKSLTITQGSLDAERGVVKEERRFRTDDDIHGKLDELYYATAYLAHPYGWPVVGWMADLDSIRVEDCRAYFRTFYAPNNCTFILVGDFDSEEALALFERYFADLPPGPPAPSVPENEPPPSGERRVIHRAPAQAEAFLAGYAVPAVGHADTYALEVLRAVLTKGESSRLHHRLVYEAQLAQAVTPDYWWRLHPNQLAFFVEMQPGKTAAQAESLLYEELDRVAREGVDERELAKAKNQLRAEMVTQLKTNENRGYLIGAYDFWLGEPLGLETALARQEAVTQDEVRAVAARYLVPRNRTVVTLVPEDVAEAQP